MLEVADKAGRVLRPASLLSALRERTADLHVRAERSGVIADMLHGRATRDDYVRLLANLLPVYQALESGLARQAGSSLVGPIVRRELARAGAIEADLTTLAHDGTAVPRLPAATAYADAIGRAADGDGRRLIAHAYARYLGDLSGGQILKKLLIRSLGLPADALTFYDFPLIPDIAAFKNAYRAAIEQAGDEIDDFDAIVEESAYAFELNIDLSLALQASRTAGIT